MAKPLRIAGTLSLTGTIVVCDNTGEFGRVCSDMRDDSADKDLHNPGYSCGIASRASPRPSRHGFSALFSASAPIILSPPGAPAST